MGKYDYPCNKYYDINYWCIFLDWIPLQKRKLIALSRDKYVLGFRTKTKTAEFVEHVSQENFQHIKTTLLHSRRVDWCTLLFIENPRIDGDMCTASWVFFKSFLGHILVTMCTFLSLISLYICIVYTFNN